MEDIVKYEQSLMSREKITSLAQISKEQRIVFVNQLGQELFKKHPNAAVNFDEYTKAIAERTSQEIALGKPITKDFSAAYCGGILEIDGLKQYDGEGIPIVTAGGTRPGYMEGISAWVEFSQIKKFVVNMNLLEDLDEHFPKTTPDFDWHPIQIHRYCYNWLEPKLVLDYLQSLYWKLNQTQYDLPSSVFKKAKIFLKKEIESFETIKRIEDMKNG